MTTPKGRDSIVLETVGISKLFGAVRAVDELSISIPRGGVTSIVGPKRFRKVHFG